VVEARLAGRSRNAPIRATTDANGGFVLRVPPGDYTLTAQTEKLVSPAPQSLRVRQDLPAEACVLKLAPRATLRR
jgi:hypothetical protein